MMEHYIEIAKIDHKSKLNVFRDVVKTKNGERLRAAGSISYTRMRELFLSKVEDLGYDLKQFSLHSLIKGRWCICS